MSFGRASYDLVPPRSQNQLKNVANMPIFIDESRAGSGNFSSRNVDVTDSFGLKALQKYGAEQSAQQFDYQQEPATPYCSNRNSDSPASSVAVPNLNSVDEEDEFLYGDTSSLPEESKSIKRPPLTASTSNIGWKEVSQSNSGWSDEDDFFIEGVYNKNEPNVNKASSAWAVKKETCFSGKNLNNSASQSSSVEKPLSNDRLLPSVSIPASVTKANVNLPVNVNKSNAISNLTQVPAAGPKSKYHAAAEILKKQAIEKNTSLKNKPLLSSDSLVIDKLVTEKPDSSSLSNKRTVILPKNAKKISLEKSGPNLPNKPAVGDQRRTAKHFFQKDLDNISKILQSPTEKHTLSPRKLEQELKIPYKGPKVDSPPRYSRMHSRSPSPRKYSSHRSRSPSYGSRHRSPFSSRHRSPNYRPRYKSPSSYKHPPYDEYKYHDPRQHGQPPRHSYDKRRHYSRSPGRHSKEKSPASKHEDLTSRSPTYQSSRGLVQKYFKPDIEKRKVSLKSSESRYKKDKSRGSSSDSFCSLSFESTSSESLVDGKSKKKNNFTKMLADEVDDGAVPQLGLEIQSSQKETLVKKLTEADYTKGLNEHELNLLNMLSPFDAPLNFINEFMRVQESTSVTESQFPSPPQVFSNISDTSYTISQSIPPTMSTPLSYSYNPVMQTSPHMFQPPSNNFMSVMPQYAAPEQYHPAMVPSYEPYPLPQVNVPPNNVPSAVPVSLNMNDVKQVTSRIKSRNQTLREIPVSTTYSPVPESLPGKTNLIEITKSPTKTVERETVTKQSSKKTPVFKPVEYKSNDDKSALIEKYKCLKADRYYAQAKVNTIVSDMIEMRNLLDDTWSKRGNINSAEKVIFGKCKNILGTSDDTMKQAIKDAKHCDELLTKFKEKLPREVQAEVSKLRTEDYIKASPEKSEKYLMFDPGKHSCYTCNRSAPNISSMLEHLHSAEHKENIDESEKESLEKFRRKPLTEDQLTDKKSSLQPVAGLEFMKPITGFFCALCKEFCIDQQDAEIHLKGSVHIVKFKKFIRDNPLYERKRLVKGLVTYSVTTKEKRKKETEELEEKTAKRKKQEAVADKKVKEMIKDQKRKEKKVEELEENDVCNVGSSSKLPGIKLTLSADKEKSKTVDNKLVDDAKESSAKNQSETKKDAKAKTKVVYIGRQPNYKSRTKPWYKRETFNKSTEEKGGSNELLQTLKEKISLSNSKTTSPKKTSPSADALTKEVTSKQNKEASLTEEAFNSDQSKRKEGFIGPVIDISESKGKDFPQIPNSASSSVNTSPHKSPSRSGVAKNKNPIVNQALQNILHGRVKPSISLSDIQLPEALTQSTGDSSVPMDISPDREPIEKTEEEKDFYILGINKEDMQPIANIVPPPSSAINYVPNSNYFQNTPPPVITNFRPPVTTMPPHNISITLPNINVPPPNLNVPPPIVNISPTITNIAPLNLNIPPPNIFNRGGGMPISPNRCSIEVLQNSYYTPPHIKSPNMSKKNKSEMNTNLITVPVQKNYAQSSSRCPKQKKLEIGVTKQHGEKLAQESVSMVKKDQLRKIESPEQEKLPPPGSESTKENVNKNTKINIESNYTKLLSTPNIVIVSKNETKTTVKSADVSTAKIDDSIKNKELDNVIQPETMNKMTAHSSVSDVAKETELETTSTAKNVKITPLNDVSQPTMIDNTKLQEVENVIDISQDSKEVYIISDNKLENIETEVNQDLNKDTKKMEIEIIEIISADNSQENKSSLISSQNYQKTKLESEVSEGLSCDVKTSKLANIVDCTKVTKPQEIKNIVDISQDFKEVDKISDNKLENAEEPKLKSEVNGLNEVVEKMVIEVTNADNSQENTNVDNSQENKSLLSSSQNYPKTKLESEVSEGLSYDLEKSKLIDTVDFTKVTKPKENANIIELIEDSKEVDLVSNECMMQSNKSEDLSKSDILQQSNPENKDKGKDQIDLTDSVSCTEHAKKEFITLASMVQLTMSGSSVTQDIEILDECTPVEIEGIKNLVFEENTMPQKAELSSESDLIKIKSSYNAESESVFNFRAFDKLAALAKDVEEEHDKNCEDESDADELVPPILEQEMCKSTHTENVEKSFDKSVSPSQIISNENAENTDSNQCAPPVLELEIVKSSNTIQKTQMSDAVEFSSNEQEYFIENDHYGSSFAIEQYSDTEIIAKKETDQSELTKWEMTEVSTSSFYIGEEKKDENSEEDENPDDDENPEEDKTCAHSNPLEEERRATLQQNLEQQLEGNETEESMEISETPVKPTCDEDSGSETDEYDENEEI